MEIDDTLRTELMDAFCDLVTEAETRIASLLEQEDDETMHSLFRAIHNIKGNAGLMQLTPIVDFTHEIEEVAGALRRKQFSISPTIAETLLIALDRLHDLHQSELFGTQFDYLCIDELKVLYGAMSKATREEADGIALQTLQFLGAGVVSADIDIFSKTETPQLSFSVPLQNLDQQQQVLRDLSFFHELSLQLDKQLPHWHERSLQLFDWAMKMNKIAGSPIPKDQLAAATYLHDLGLSFVERDQWTQSWAPQPDTALYQHPNWAYQILIRIPGWEDAATIILHHHERINGTGYPSGLQGNDIHPGAKILAILDSFFLLTNGRVDASARKSTVRAVSAINARLDTHFEGLWVQCFNHMIRTELRSGKV